MCQRFFMAGDHEHNDHSSFFRVVITKDRMSFLRTLNPVLSRMMVSEFLVTHLVSHGTGLNIHNGVAGMSMSLLRIVVPVMGGRVIFSRVKSLSATEARGIRSRVSSYAWAAVGSESIEAKQTARMKDPTAEAFMVLSCWLWPVNGQ